MSDFSDFYNKETLTLLDTPSQSYIKKAIAFIELNYARDLSIPEIAAYVNVHAIYLNKLFKISTGKTVSEYLNSYRISMSKKLLLESRETVYSISEQVGYKDIRSFIRFFKKYDGITPNEFRKGMAEK